MYQFDLKIRYNRGSQPPTMNIGLFEKALGSPLFFTVPIDTAEQELFDKCGTFAVIQERLHPDWTVNCTRIRSQIRAAKRWHAWATRPVGRRAEPFDNDAWQRRHEEYEKERAEREEAKRKGRELLAKIAPELVDKVDQPAFYIQGESNWYIVDTHDKKLVLLGESVPESLCVYIKDEKVQDNIYDWLITVWLYLKGAEGEFLSVANHFGGISIRESRFTERERKPPE